MKNITKIIYSVFVLMFVVSFASSANGSTLPNIYVTPTGITKNVSESFTVTVNVSSSNSKFYAVEGTLSFKNLNCESITVAGRLMPQTAPTCANPYFLVGIPNGTSIDTKVLEIKVSGIEAGDANINIDKIDIIGEGKSLSNNGTNGIYTIKSVSSTSGSYTGQYNVGSAVSKTAKVGRTVGSKSVEDTFSPKVKVLDSSNSGPKKLGENNPFVATAKDAFEGVSTFWLLILIIICLSTYITLRETYLYKRK